MSSVKLKVEARELIGKGAARKIRAAGKIPAVLYDSKGSSTALTVTPLAFVKAMKTPHKRNVVLELDIDGKVTKALAKDIQIDPVKRVPLHVDFWALPSDKAVTVAVPVERVGRSKLVQLGAKLQVVLRSIKVNVAADKIPVAIEVDVTDLEKGAFRASQLNLPEGCELAVDGHVTVLTLSTPRGQKTGAAEGEAQSADA